MKLFSLEIAGHQLYLLGSPRENRQTLYLNGTVIDDSAALSMENQYSVELPEIGHIRLNYRVDDKTGQTHIQLRTGDRLVFEGAQDIHKLNRSAAPGKPARGWHPWAWLGVGFKLLKSAKVVQIGLAGLSASTLGLLFSWEFALAIIGILVFHEYGHLLAMKKFGIPTKGIYLIPFVGGVAVGDRPRTHWQEVYISMMGPVFGLLMTIIFGLIYYFTGNHFCGLVASVGALVNLFNLLPVLPLDGGRVCKAMALSGQGKAGFVTVILLTLGGLFFSIKFGLGLLTFFFILGLLDLAASWREMKNDPLVGMNSYGIAFSLVWYVITAVLFIAIILLMAGTGLPGTELAASILREA